MTNKADVLVVDDDETTCEALRLMLGLHHYGVDTANSALEALSMMANKKFDLVLADLAMPGMDGLELLDEIRQRYEDTSVMIITAYPATEIVIQALRRGASDFITKPYHPGELLAIVHREVKQRKEAEALAALESAAFTEVEVDSRFSAKQFEDINILLAGLRAESNANCILLVDRTGKPLAVKGFTENLDIDALTETAASNVTSASGMASAIGEGASFRLNYYEGVRHSVYSALITPDTFLLIVFGHDIRTGMVQLATRQTMPRLRGVIEFGSEDAIPAAPSVRASDIRREMAVDLYRRKLLTLEKAAEMAKSDLDDFKKVLFEEGVKLDA